LAALIRRLSAPTGSRPSARLRLLTPVG
jgi:hypothetical protein